MYLKTEFAWYILDAPSKLYKSYFSGFWLKHQVLHLLVTSALADPTITLAKFLQSPEVKGDASAISQVLKRTLSKDDILSEDMVRLPFCL
jgi:DNA (cytosine-5)-methyltransferase 1